MINHDGSRIVITEKAENRSGPRVVVFDVMKKQAIFTSDSGLFTAYNSISPDGKLVAAAVSPDQPEKKLKVIEVGDANIKIWDLSNPKREPIFISANTGIVILPADLQSGRLASGRSNYEIEGGKTVQASFLHIWDTATGQSRVKLPLKGVVTKCLGFSPDGTRLITLERPITTTSTEDSKMEFDYLGWSG